MNNKFSIGDQVIRKLTNTKHTIEDLSHNPQLEQFNPLTGEFSQASSPWNYRIGGFDMWIVEAALAPVPDDWTDPAYYEKSDPETIEKIA